MQPPQQAKQGNAGYLNTNAVCSLLLDRYAEQSGAPCAASACLAGNSMAMKVLRVATRKRGHIVLASIAAAGFLTYAIVFVTVLNLNLNSKAESNRSIDVTATMRGNLGEPTGEAASRRMLYKPQTVQQLHQQQQQQQESPQDKWQKFWYSDVDQGRCLAYATPMQLIWLPAGLQACISVATPTSAHTCPYMCACLHRSQTYLADMS